MHQNDRGLAFLNARRVASSRAMLSRSVNAAICWPTASTAGWTSLCAWDRVMRLAIGRWLKHSGMPLRGSFSRSAAAEASTADAAAAPAAPGGPGCRARGPVIFAPSAPPLGRGPLASSCFPFDFPCFCWPPAAAGTAETAAAVGPPTASLAAITAARRLAFSACFNALSSAPDSFFGVSPPAAATLSFDSFGSFGSFGAFIGFSAAAVCGVCACAGTAVCPICWAGSAPGSAAATTPGACSVAILVRYEGPIYRKTAGSYWRGESEARSASGGVTRGEHKDDASRRRWAVWRGSLATMTWSERRQGVQMLKRLPRSVRSRCTVDLARRCVQNGHGQGVMSQWYTQRNGDGLESLAKATMLE